MEVSFQKRDKRGDTVETHNRIAQARKDAGIMAKDLSETLGVDVSTLYNWENGHRQPTLDRLIQTAELLNVSVSYLLGFNEQQIGPLTVIDKTTLPMLHRMPVWIKSQGWALVNIMNQMLVFPDKSEIPFEALQEPVYLIAPTFALSLRGVGDPLSPDDIITRERIWVEPITSDSDLASELRGWYRPRHKGITAAQDTATSQAPQLVENEYGNRFYLDTYGAKWLAFESCISKTGDI